MVGPCNGWTVQRSLETPQNSREVNAGSTKSSWSHYRTMRLEQSFWQSKDCNSAARMRQAGIFSFHLNEVTTPPLCIPAIRMEVLFYPPSRLIDNLLGVASYNKNSYRKISPSTIPLLP